MAQIGNPWLDISESDYVGHMSSPDVNQRPVLSRLLRDALESAPLRPTDGWLSIPASPGLGVAVDEATLARFSPRHGA